jgi:Flp pilus assembly protein TadG
VAALNFRLYIKKSIQICTDCISCTGGNFSLMLALLLPMLALAAGGVMQYMTLLNDRAAIQAALDSGVLKAAALKTEEEQQTAVTKFMSGNWSSISSHTNIVQSGIAVKKNADNSLTATFSGTYTPELLKGFGFSAFDITVTSTAIATAQAAATSSASGSCIMVMGNQSQALLVNSGAFITSSTCGIYVNSVQDPAFIMNSGSSLSTTQFCVRGNKYINNGGTITNPVYGCAAQTNPYAGTLPTPTVSSVCETSGWKDGSNFTINPGVHCGTGFNGSPTITFAPGLHIIKDTMIINSGAIVTAKDVTFYFPDANSKIQFNGNVTFKASAPTTGTYAGLLMFENTANSSNKTQLVFNGTPDFSLSGIIALPNRDVTFNSTSNLTSSISMVVNTMILNAANWNITSYTSGSSSTSTSSVGASRLTR